MRSKTTSALALRLAGTKQGGMYFYSLLTGNRITGCNWTTLPIPPKIITQAHRLARKTKATNGLLFQYRDQCAVEDNHTNDIIAAGVDDIAAQGNNKYDDEYSDGDNEDSIPPLIQRDYEYYSDSDSDSDYEDSDDDEEEDDDKEEDDGEEDDNGWPDDYEAYLDRDEEYDYDKDGPPPSMSHDSSDDEDSNDDNGDDGDEGEDSPQET